MKPRIWIALTLTLLLLATALHIAGLLAPCWIYLESSDFRVGVGLYFRIGCEASSGNNCTHASFPTDLSFGYNSASTYEKSEWEAVLWLETISAVFALLLCVMMAVYLIGFGEWRRMGVLNMLMTCVSAATWFVAIAGLIVYVASYGKVITRSPDISSRSFPWSALMVLLAALLFIIITILIRLRCRNRNYLQNAIPTSADSKMALNPSTRNQVMKRYFSPSPYREDRREAITSTQNSIAPTEQDQQQENAFGRLAIDHTSPNGNLRYDNGWHEDTWNNGLLQTNQLRPGVTAAGSTTAGPSKTTHQTNVNSGIVITSIGPRPQNQQQMVYRQQQEHHQKFQEHQNLKHKQLQNSRVQTNKDVLADTQIDNFDSETIFYKGRGEFTARNLSFVDGSTDNKQRDLYGYSLHSMGSRGGYVNGAFIDDDLGRWDEMRTPFHTTEFRTPSPPPHEQRPSSVGSFRIGAEHQDLEPVKELYTTHMRRPNNGGDRVLTGAPSSNGKGIDYNRKFMYRPYSEQSY